MLEAIEHCADPLDFAARLSERELENCLAAQRLKCQGEGSPYCEECGDAIPKARRLAVPSTTHCISCQEELDIRSHCLRA